MKDYDLHHVLVGKELFITWSLYDYLSVVLVDILITTCTYSYSFKNFLRFFIIAV